MDDKNSGQNQTQPDNAAQRRLKIGWASYLQIFATLVVVLLIIYALFWVIKKKLKIDHNFGEETFILSSQSIGPGKWIQVVFVGGKYLVLGITNENIRLLSEITEPREIERLEILYNNRKTETGRPFFDLISDFFKKKNQKITTKNFNYETDSVDFFKEQNERLKKLNDKDG